jgi:hypothetical protein
MTFLTKISPFHVVEPSHDVEQIGKKPFVRSTRNIGISFGNKARIMANVKQTSLEMLETSKPTASISQT